MRMGKAQAFVILRADPQGAKLGNTKLNRAIPCKTVMSKGNTVYYCD